MANNDTPIICNGFKDFEFIEMAMLALKMGRKIIPVVEIMRATTTIQACIREGKLDEIERHIEKGRSQYQMQTLDQQRSIHQQDSYQPSSAIKVSPFTSSSKHD